MKWTCPFLAFLLLLMAWNFWGTVVSGKKDSQRGLSGSHKLFHKKFCGNTNLRYKSPKLRKMSSTGETFGIKKAESQFTNKRSFVAASPDFRERATDGGWNLEPIPEDVKASNGKDARGVLDTGDVEFIDGADGDEVMEITSGPEAERSKTSTVGSAKTRTDEPSREKQGRRTTDERSREKQGRRQHIESDADFSYQETNQAEREHSNDEEYIEKENPSSNNIAGSDYGNIGPGAAKPVDYGTGPSRDNPLRDEVQSDYQRARLSMAEGTNKDSELFHDELDGVLGALVKSDSALGGKPVDHDQRLDAKKPSYFQSADNDERDSGMSSDTTSTRSSDDSVASVEEIVTETEGNTTDEAGESHPQGTTASSNNEGSSHSHTSVEEIPAGETHQITLETSRKTGKDSHSTAPAVKEAETADDVSETDIEEIDDENEKMVDGDVSLLDQSSQPVKSIPNNGGNNDRVENAVEGLHESNEQEVKLEQSFHDGYISHENSIQTGSSVKEVNAAKNVKTTENNTANPPQSGADQTKQFTGAPAVTNQRLGEAPSNGATSENQQLEGITPPLHQEPQGRTKAGAGSPLAKLLIEVNRQAAKMHESGNEQTHASKFNAALERPLKGRFTNKHVESRTRSAHSDITPVSNRSLGLLMHEILLNYFKNESALHGILKSQVNPTGHPSTNLNLNSSSVAKYFSHAAKPLGSNNSHIDSKIPQELQSQDKNGFTEKWGNITRQSITEAGNTNQTQLSASSSNNKNNTNNNINSNNNESTANNLQEVAPYMDPASSLESSRTSHAIKKQELNGSEEEMFLVLKNKTFGILIGRHKNATVRLLSDKSAPNSSGEQVTAKSAPNSDGEHVTTKSVPNNSGEQATTESAPNNSGEQATTKSAPNNSGEQATTESAPNSDGEHVTAAENDVSAATQPNMDINTKTNSLTEAKPQNINLNQSEGPLNGISQQHIELVTSGSAKSQVDERTRDSASYIKDLKSLEIVFSRDFMNDWMYDQKTFGDLGISPAMLRSGVASLGISTRLRRVFRKALRGTDINLLVVAGSISAGAGLEVDRKNLAGVYYKAFVNWWYRSIAPIAASKLKVNAVAIGGTDSEYFSYCIKNYVDQLPDIVIWELASNDYRRYKGRNFTPGKPLEQLTRKILSWSSHPALVFVNFFGKKYYGTTVGQDCPSSEDEGGQTIAKYYGIPALSWRNVICPEIGATMSIDGLFSSDGSHPNILGHAQMASLLITYMKGVFEKTIILERDEETGLSNNVKNKPDREAFSLPQPMYNNAISLSSMCWTLLTPDYTSKVHNTLPEMDFISVNGFQFTNISHWPIRLDRQRCLRALDQDATLKIKFFVPPLQTLNQANSLNASGARKVVIFSHNSFGGSARAWLDENHGEAQVIAKISGPRRTQTDILNTSLMPGLHTLTIQDIEQGFCLSAVAVS